MSRSAPRTPPIHPLDAADGDLKEGPLTPPLTPPHTPPALDDPTASSSEADSKAKPVPAAAVPGKFYCSYCRAPLRKPKGGAGAVLNAHTPCAKCHTALLWTCAHSKCRKPVTNKALTDKKNRACPHCLTPEGDDGTDASALFLARLCLAPLALYLALPAH
jgi:hypothetical protein